MLSWEPIAAGGCHRADNHGLMGLWHHLERDRHEHRRLESATCAEHCRRARSHPSYVSKGLVSGVAVRFWGVRGSIACPDNGVARYGGNTSCVEVRCGDNLLILDGGSGIRQLGKALLEQQTPVEADVYSHIATSIIFAGSRSSPLVICPVAGCDCGPATCILLMVLPGRYDK